MKNEKPFRQRKQTLYSISQMKVTPAMQAKYHRGEAVKALKANNYAGYRYHSLEVAKINTNLVIGKMRGKKGTEK